MHDASLQVHALSLVSHADRGVLDVTWNDGLTMQFDHGLLRACCQCADCKVRRDEGSCDEIRPRLTLARLTEIRPVGTYGIQLVFDDGHDRGIYPWSYLYKLGGSDARN